jgi:hypothetical protein
MSSMVYGWSNTKLFCSNTPKRQLEDGYITTERYRAKGSMQDVD